MSDQYSPDAIVSLIKFGKECHMKELLDTGQLFMQTVGYFKELKGDGARGDPFEGGGQMGTHPKMETHPKIRAITIDGRSLNPDDIVRATVLTAPVLLETHVFCMTGVSWETAVKMVDGGNAVHPRATKEFDDTALVILNPKKFFERVDAACRQRDEGYDRGWITYVDPSSYMGPISLHNKCRCYDWQTEYRIAVPPTGEKTLFLDVGSLKDIAQISSASEVNSMFSATAGQRIPPGSELGSGG